MPRLLTGLDHYQIVSNDGAESEYATYGDSCVLVEPETGDVLFCFLDIPANDGSVRGANGLDVAVYRILLPGPDNREDTVVEDAGPDGFDFEREEDYISPFDEDEDEDEDDVDDEDDAGDDNVLDGDVPKE